MFNSFIATLLISGHLGATKSIVAPRTQIALSLTPSEPVSEESFLAGIRDEIHLGVEACYVNIKWSDLEGEQAFNAKALQDQLGIAKLLGGEVVLCIKLIDTSVKCVPIALATQAFDSAQMVSQWESMLQKVVPLLPKNVKAIALGNEVDVYLGNHPDEVSAYLNLVKSTKTFLRGAGLNIPVGVVTTFDGLQRRAALVKQIQSNFDVTMMTYYPVDQKFEILSMSQVGSNFDQMLAVAGSKPLMLTEVGCPSGELNKSSEDIQTEFVKTVFGQLEKHAAQISFASYFQQGDFPTQFVDMFEQYYQLKDDRFRSYLSSLGLKKTDGKPKKAYAEFKKQIRAWNGD
jgi:hypothetical protein